jgi:predicted acetyltransferase
MPHVELVAAALHQQAVVANLLELYIHDFSEFHHVEIGEDGKFGYPNLSLYWSEPDRYPFLVRVDGKLAGFVLVKKSTVSDRDAVWDMAEFFIVRRYRNRGIGTGAAHEVWKRFPGQWKVRVMQSNVLAHHFWERAISVFTGEAANPVHAEQGGERWQVFSFESKPVS